MAGRPTRSRSWPLTAVIVGMPLWWALGLGGLIWQIAAIPMAAILLRKTPVRAPKGFGTYMLFIAWVFVSMTQADGLRFISVGYRLVLYIATAIVFLYVFNLSHKELPRERILKLAVIYTGFAVLGGYLAVTFGDFEFTSVTESLLPAAIRQNDYAVSLVHPTLAQNQSFLGFPLYRPTAPFTFTNEWGSALALLAPLMMAAFAGLDRKWRTWIVLIGFLALVPIVVSVNRGLWIGLLVGVTYGVFVLASKGDMRYLVGMLVAGAVIGLALVASPLGTLISERIANGHSDDGRLTLYSQVIDQVQDSPLVGYGAPRVNEERPGLPAVGTHGQFWTVLYSHGIPGAVIYVMFSIGLAWRTLKNQDRVGVWIHVTTALVPMLMWYYELINQPIFLVFIAGAIALRGVPDEDGQAPPARSSTATQLVPTGTQQLART
ncbi:MAG: O-antigen ligase family protein [Acidimicrobiales bacterium]|nr:O-antigen ligase family protein [Acidimicrobiales bacterium]